MPKAYGGAWRSEEKSEIHLFFGLGFNCGDPEKKKARDDRLPKNMFVEASVSKN